MTVRPASIAATRARTPVSTSLDRSLLQVDAAVHGLDHQLPSATADLSFQPPAAHAALHGKRKIGVETSIDRAEVHVGIQIVRHFERDGAIHGLDMQGSIP